MCKRLVCARCAHGAKIAGLDFANDNSGRLIEWIELHRLLGAAKIMMYTYTMHWRTARVLQHYRPFVETVRLTLPGNAPNNESLARSRYIWRNRQQVCAHILRATCDNRNAAMS
jgi:hypothetical protein